MFHDTIEIWRRKRKRDIVSNEDSTASSRKLDNVVGTQVTFASFFKPKDYGSDSDEDDNYFARNGIPLPMASAISNSTKCDENLKMSLTRKQSENNMTATEKDSSHSHKHKILSQKKSKEDDHNETINFDDFVSCEIVTKHPTEIPWNEKPFDRTCLFCRVSFTDKWLFLNHNELCFDGCFKKKMPKDYHGPKIYSCGSCSNEYGTKDSLVIHMKRNHLGKFVCNTCKRVLRSEKAVENHCLTHTTRSKIYKCKVIKCRSLPSFKNRARALAHLLADHFDHEYEGEQVDDDSEYDISEANMSHDAGATDSEDEIIEEDTNPKEKEQEVQDIIVVDDVQEQDLVNLSDEDTSKIEPKEKITAQNYLKFIKFKKKPPQQEPQQQVPDSPPKAVQKPTSVPTCLICDTRFLSSIHLKWHNIHNHIKYGDSTMVKSLYPCSSCSQTFTKFENLSIHEFTTHYTPHRIMMCGYCEYRTHLMDSFNAHLILCTNVSRQEKQNIRTFVPRNVVRQVQQQVKPIVPRNHCRCDMCGSVFGHISFLAAHIESEHRGVKRLLDNGEYHCSLCNRNFKCLQAIDSHIKAAKKHNNI